MILFGEFMNFLLIFNIDDVTLVKNLDWKVRKSEKSEKGTSLLNPKTKKDS
jgi:hypothetical protein